MKAIFLWIECQILDKVYVKMAQQLSPLDGQTDSSNGTANGRCKRKGAPDDQDDVAANAQLSPHSHKNDLPAFSLIDAHQEVCRANHYATSLWWLSFAINVLSRRFSNAGRAVAMSAQCYSVDSKRCVEPALSSPWARTTACTVFVRRSVVPLHSLAMSAQLSGAVLHRSERQTHRLIA